MIGLQDNRRKFSDNEKQVLFDEVHGRCPICGRRLTHSKNGHFYRTFEVAHIYPANPKTEEEKLLATEERLSDDVNSLKMWLQYAEYVTKSLIRLELLMNTAHGLG